jgi:hypothetical protein
MNTRSRERAEVPESVLSKIQKLLALTASPNENEAAVAASKAQELLIQYKLEMVDIEDLRKKDDKSDEVGEKRIKMGVSKWQPWQWLVVLGGGVADACYCRILFVAGRSLTFIGEKEDCAVAVELFQWLREQIYRLGIEESRKNAELMHPLKFRPSFWNGCARRVADLLFWKRADAEAANVKVTALAKNADALNEEYMKAEYPKLKYVTVGVSTSKWAEAKGFEAGDNIDLVAKKKLEEGRGRLGE